MLSRSFIPPDPEETPEAEDELAEAGPLPADPELWEPPVFVLPETEVTGRLFPLFPPSKRPVSLPPPSSITRTIIIPSSFPLPPEARAGPEPVPRAEWFCPAPLPGRGVFILRAD